MTLKSNNLSVASASPTPAPLSSEQAQTISNLVLGGDLSKMNPEQRVTYYVQLCQSLNLNPLTQPFQIFKLSGKEVLYATKSCTEQLRKQQGVSVISLEPRNEGDVYLVVATVQDATGRTDAATGAVPVTNMKGEALANAFMKAETKAKRRATLSICGLGMLDESELDTLPQGVKVGLPQAAEIGTSATVVEEVPAIAMLQEDDGQVLDGYAASFEAATSTLEVQNLWCELSGAQKKHLLTAKDAAKARVNKAVQEAASTPVPRPGGTVPPKVPTITNPKQPAADAQGQPVQWATIEQKDEIMGLIQHALITRPEKTKMITGILKLDVQRADEAIANLKKAIEEREGGAGAVAQSAIAA